MVSKRSGNSRDDKSGRSSNRASRADDRPKRSSRSKGNPSTNFESKDNGQSVKKFGGDRSRDKTSTASAGNKPYKKRESGDQPSGSSDAFRSGSSEGKRAPGFKKPYSGRTADSVGSSGGSRSAYGKKPYSGRSTDSSSYRGGEPSREKRSFEPRSKPFASRSNDATDKPKKNFASRAPGKGRAFVPDKPATGSFNAAERPKRTANNFRGGEGNKKFGERPAAGRGFKKSDTPYNTDRPERTKPVYDKITRDTDAPVKTLRGRKKGAEAKDTGLIRLNRYISNAGICSRRKADELIAAGVVSVNGEVISELGHKVDPQKDVIRYNGETLKREKMVYVLLNKPKDYITTTDDPQERRTVMHLVEKASKERIYPIGRLDRNTTGLLLMTNDGDLADKLSHPRNNIVKLYQAELNKNLTQGDLNKIGFGLELDDGLIKPDFISYVSGGTKREVGIQVHSGKNRIVRRIFEHLGYEVMKLDRTVYANLTKKDLPRGRWRFLDESEVIMLKHLV
jgi:23S rRNA pseudouridine2605 synthase